MNVVEREFLLAVERGDQSTVKQLLDSGDPRLDINCCDPLARNALILAINNENVSMVKILVESGIRIGYALLYAIDENFVEAVELLLDHEEASYRAGELHSWEQDRENSPYSDDMTPLILAAHRNNCEIIKILVDRKISPIPDPHDPSCHCEACCDARAEDCLKHSRSRINAYMALASPCLIALCSEDPLLRAFEMSTKLENLAKLEPEYKQVYMRLRAQCQTFATKLLDYTRTSHELEILLNYSEQSEMSLARLRLAIHCKQKTFCAHPNIQELLASMWYKNLPGFRKKNPFAQCLQIIFIGLMFPVYSIAYLVAPNTQLGKYIKKPFIKFVCHSASYITFLIVLILASQRVEAFYSWNSVLGLFHRESSKQTNSFIVMEGNFSMYKQVPPTIEDLKGWYKQLNAAQSPSARSFDSLTKMFEQLPASSKKRGTLPSPIELVILVWVISLTWAELKQLRTLGLNYYKADMWNALDSVASGFYIGTIILRIVSFIQSDEESANIAREFWHAYDPILLSEGLFAAATIFSALKLVYIFSINPYLGPLQISLGRMVIDIFSFSWIYMLVLFSFACGMNQLLWYYADLERHQCLNVTNYSLAHFYAASDNQPNQGHSSSASVEVKLSSSRIPEKVPVILAGGNTSLTSNLSTTTVAPVLAHNITEEKLMEAAFEASLEDDSSKPPVTLDPSCKTWRYFANVFESSQTLFWATFGLVDLENFDLTGIQQYTRFWALLMFGCYCFINVIVVLNLLIAMMNHSYVKISKKSDIEWKFARTRLWMSYFDTGSTVPAPFNILPSLKSSLKLFKRLLRLRTSKKAKIDNEQEVDLSLSRRESSLEFHNPISLDRPKKVSSYRKLMKALVRRYQISEARLLERKRGLTEAKLDRWAKF